MGCRCRVVGVKEGHEAVYLPQSWFIAYLCCGVEIVTAGVFRKLLKLFLSRTWLT